MAFMGDRKNPTDIKRLGGDPEVGSGLLAFVFAAMDAANNILD